MEKLLSVAELAELLGIAKGSLYHWISEGRIPVVRLSKRCVRFRESDIEQMMEMLSSDRDEPPKR